MGSKAIPARDNGLFEQLTRLSPESLQALLFPKLLNLTIYTTLLDTTTSEHAARMMAMQTANDNANDLIQELTLQYNKTRQQAERQKNR